MGRIIWFLVVCRSNFVLAKWNCKSPAVWRPTGSLVPLHFLVVGGANLDKAAPRQRLGFDRWLPWLGNRLQCGAPVRFEDLRVIAGDRRKVKYDPGFAVAADAGVGPILRADQDL